LIRRIRAFCSNDAFGQSVGGFDKVFEREYVENGMTIQPAIEK
jgi:hypothetical protein